ncbi:MAG: DUF4381 family protein [Candidatus Omnitrophota bacterium]
MKYRPFLIALMICCLAAPAVMAAQTNAPKVKAKVDRRSVFIGDIVTLNIEVAAGKSISVEFPKFADNKIGDFEIRDSGASRRVSFFRRPTYTGWYRIAAYNVGKFTLPALEVKYRENKTAAWSSAKTSEMTINVESVLKRERNADDIKEIKGPIGLREIPVAAIASAGLALAICLVSLWLYRRSRRRAVIKTPYQTALDELDGAKAGFSTTGDVKEYYAAVSGAVRRYIEAVFRLRAPEMTTEEFLVSLETSGSLSAPRKELLKDFLVACDFVKFAKHMPKETETDNLLTTARRFFDETRPLPAEKKGAG